MNFFRSRIVKSVKWLLERQDRVLAPSNQFGINPFADVRRLASTWNNPIKTIFDVGANDGETALSVLEEFPEARVLSFEPHPSTFAKLVARVGSSPRFRGFNLALGTDIGEVEMIEYDESKTNSLTPDSQFAKRFKTQGRSIRVKETTLDSFCSENLIDRIDLLKIDTEGFDLVVLQGCSSMLRKQSIRFILVEFNELQPREGVFGGALMPFENMLSPFGFRFVASYNDYIKTQGEMFFVSNALFCLPPHI
jgi:FkbM family methyltransferase